MRAVEAPATAALTIERALELQRPVEVELSADGLRVAFTVAPVSKEKGKGLETRLWLGGRRRARTADRGRRDRRPPALLADGTQFAFASDRGHTAG